LKPKDRLDKGASRKIGTGLGEAIKKKVEEYQFLSSAAIYRLLISEGIIGAREISEGTTQGSISGITGLMWHVVSLKRGKDLRRSM